MVANAEWRHFKDVKYSTQRTFLSESTSRHLWRRLLSTCSSLLHCLVSLLSLFYTAYNTALTRGVFGLRRTNRAFRPLIIFTELICSLPINSRAIYLMCCRWAKGDHMNLEVAWQVLKLSWMNTEANAITCKIYVSSVALPCKMAVVWAVLSLTWACAGMDYALSEELWICGRWTGF